MSYVLAFTLIAGWILGLVYYNAGAGIHLLPFIAMISVAGNQHKQRKLHRRLRKS